MSLQQMGSYAGFSVSTVFTAAALLVAPGAFAQSAAAGANAFVLFPGSWAGEGTVTTSSGTSERIRCRAKYSVSPSGGALHQALRCASDSYKFDVSADVVEEGGAVSGTWTEANRGATGHISGRIADGKLKATIAGPSFTARLKLKTRSDRQTVSIQPQGVEVTGITITLRRG